MGSGYNTDNSYSVNPSDTESLASGSQNNGNGNGNSNISPRTRERKYLKEGTESSRQAQRRAEQLKIERRDAQLRSHREKYADLSEDEDEDDAYNGTGHGDRDGDFANGRPYENNEIDDGNGNGNANRKACVPAKKPSSSFQPYGSSLGGDMGGSINDTGSASKGQGQGPRKEWNSDFNNSDDNDNNDDNNNNTSISPGGSRIGQGHMMNDGDEAYPEGGEYPSSSGNTSGRERERENREIKDTRISYGKLYQQIYQISDQRTQRPSKAENAPLQVSLSLSLSLSLRLSIKPEI